MKTNRMAKSMAKRRLKSGRVITRGNVSMKGAPAKAGAKVSGVQMQTSTLNENSKRSVTGPRNSILRCVSA
jgi:ribosomal 50S subunit-recycling heat shock protein